MASLFPVRKETRTRIKSRSLLNDCRTNLLRCDLLLKAPLGRRLFIALLTSPYPPPFANNSLPNDAIHYHHFCLNLTPNHIDNSLSFVRQSGLSQYSHTRRRRSCDHWPHLCDQNDADYYVAWSRQQGCIHGCKYRRTIATHARNRSFFFFLNSFLLVWIRTQPDMQNPDAPGHSSKADNWMQVKDKLEKIPYVWNEYMLFFKFVF